MSRAKGLVGQAPVLTPAQVAAVARALERGPNGLRNRTIWLIGQATACRVTEVLRLRVGDVWAFGNGAGPAEPLAQAFLDGSRTKTRTSATLYLNSTARHALKVWMLARGACGPKDPLFPSSQDPSRCLSYRQYQKELVRVRDEVGIPRLMSHSMRRTSLTQDMKNKVPLAVIQKKSRHKNLAVLQRYLEVSDEQVADAGELQAKDLEALLHS